MPTPFYSGGFPGHFSAFVSTVPVWLQEQAIGVFPTVLFIGTGWGQNSCNFFAIICSSSEKKYQEKQKTPQNWQHERKTQTSYDSGEAENRLRKLSENSGGNRVLFSFWSRGKACRWSTLKFIPWSLHAIQMANTFWDYNSSNILRISVGRLLME